MTESINPTSIFDKNNNWIIESNELEKLWISKTELEKLWIQVELENIKTETLDSIIETTIPKVYQQEILAMNKVEKQWYIFLFQLWEKILGKKTIEILAEWNKPLPLGEVTTFLTELVEAEEDRNLLETSTIVLTLDEIKELKQEIFTENYTKKRLKEFVQEQLNENISSSEIINWTKLERKLKEAGYDKNFIKNMDTISSFVFSNKLSEDTTHNMWTWLTITIARLFNENEFSMSMWSIFSSIKNGKLELNWEKDNKIINLFKVINYINKAVKELNLNKETSENNELLMNPEKFSQFLYEAILNNYDFNTIKAEIKDNQWDKHAQYDKKEIISNLKWVFNEIGENISVEELKESKTQLDSVNTFWDTVKQIKEGIWWVKKQAHNWVENNKSILLWFKEVLVELWLWKLIKDLINKILKFLWFENGWDDIEEKVESKNMFKETVEYFKEKTSLENIKKDKDSIFFKWFEKNLQENSKEKVETTKAEWILSTNALYYLSSLGTNKDNLKTNLDEFLKSDNFKKTIKAAWMKEEDFYKKVFSIKEEKQDDNKIYVWIINLGELSKVIEKAKNKEIEEIIEKKAKIVETNYTSWKWVTLDKLPKEEQEKIKTLIAAEESNFKKLVQKYFPNISNFSYSAYLAWIWYVESTNRYNLVNWIWATWKYQFMPYTLKDYWITDVNWFKNNPYLQEQIMAKYTANQLKTIAKILKKHWVSPANWANIAFYLAKSHLGWAGAVLKNRSDGNITQNKYAQKATNVYNNLA